MLRSTWTETQNNLQLIGWNVDVLPQTLPHFVFVKRSLKSWTVISLRWSLTWAC